MILTAIEDRALSLDGAFPDQFGKLHGTVQT